MAPHPECVRCGRLPEPRLGDGLYADGYALLDATIELTREHLRPRWRAEAEELGVGYADYLRVTTAPRSEAPGESRRAPGHRASGPKSHLLIADAPPGSLADEAATMGMDEDSYAALVAIA